ncbi:cellulase family glycosylhydrolase [Eubacterium sp. AM46-8]|uniref:cellulase family glycosylhydrolase n=1 Tax=Eubacterium sp. AM46-8 TaxID=2292350 RepID=UPI000E4EC486|nr:cellulase family glycosylhydrolase [Eubacterium sp. AM46-8]RGZ90898.1 glycoside hydrolase family 5 candidate endoglucanase [Eubacterium sp. AM46-8]
MNRKKLCIIIVIAIIATGLAVTFAVLSKSGKHKESVNAESTVNNEKQTDSVTEAAKEDERKQVQTSVTMQFKQSNSWEGNGRFYAQYDLVIDNKEAVKISDWTFKFNTISNTTLEQCWNCTVDTSDSEWSVVPVDYNKIIESQAQMNNVGLIISSASKEGLTKYTLDFKLESGEEIVLANDGNTAQPGGSDSGNDSGNNSDTGSNAGIVTTVPTGRLQVSGTKLTDESGNVIQLRGVSTHGISWYPDYVNYDAFATLRDDWGANVVRIAMYPEEYNGYLSGGDKAELKQIIDNGVNYATQIGMYVIIDWHVLNYAPSRHTQEACDFFAEMSSKYSGHDNVIYEICNEPVGADWNSDIKPYAETVIGTIRKYDDHALILVGTNTWSQDVDSVVGNTLDDGNVMYVAHFYAGTHKENIRNKISTALNAGVPVFISECSICDASGNGGIDYASANEWLDFMNSNQLSFIAWSLSNKAETSALISSGCSAKSGWSDGDLSETGRWFKSAISGR